MAAILHNTIHSSGSVCGIDEAGRGALAGPLVAAAVVLSTSGNEISRHAGFPIRDGKTLTAIQRTKIYQVLQKTNALIAIETISVRSINNHGIAWANKEIMKRLVKKVPADRYILDGTIRIGRIAGNPSVQSIPHADATVAEVICAGIVAKVARDNLMRELHRLYPEYGWDHNCGYGTAEHIRAICAVRSTRYHRSIFVATALKKVQNLPASTPAATAATSGESSAPGKSR